MVLEPEQSSAIERFAAVALAYCTMVESEPGEAMAEMRTFAKLLAALHLSALDLPDVWDENAGDTPRAAVTLPVRGRFANLPLDTYWDVFDPLTVAPEAPVCNSLSDDLTDIYHDLERGSSFFATGDVAAAAWEWRFHFRVHWGNHLVGAQRAIHLWLASS